MTAALPLYIEPALAWLASSGHNPSADSRDARRMLLAIAYRESDCRHRLQIGADGQPLSMLARGFWQFERDGGCAEIVEHPRLTWCRAAIMALGYPIRRDELHRAIGYDQTLACVMARGLLWVDPSPLPRGVDEAYNYYIRRWRPGKPRPEKWPANWQKADALTREEWGE